MPHSLSYPFTHIVFSAEDRAPVCVPQLNLLHAYLATDTRNADCQYFLVGGVADHVHLADRLSHTTTVAKLLEELKTSSSKRLKIKNPI